MRHKKRNAGFTLVELIIVLAVSAILLSILLISYNVVNNANVQKSARRLDTIIRVARTRTMAKGLEAGKLTLYEDHGKIYAALGTDPDKIQTELICNSGVTMTALQCQTDYTVTAGGIDIPAAGLTIQFSTNGTLQNFTDTPPYNKFILTRGNKRFEVIVYTETGTVDTNML